MPTETEVCNLALGKIGGAGDALGGNAFITSINGTDKVSAWCKLNFPRVRRRVIKDMAIAGAPFKATVRFGDLGGEVTSLPETGDWEYAFNLPGDCLMVVCQFDEANIAVRRQGNLYTNPTDVLLYQWELIANSAGSGLLFLTDNLTNEDGDSAFIEYIIDTPETGAWNEEMIDAVATLLAVEVCPTVGRDLKTSQALLIKYETLIKAKAKAANMRDFDNRSRYRPGYLGGRTSSLEGV